MFTGNSITKLEYGPSSRRLAEILIAHHLLSYRLWRTPIAGRSKGLFGKGAGQLLMYPGGRGYVTDAYKPALRVDRGSGCLPMAGSSTFLNTLLMLKKYSARLVMFWQTFGRLRLRFIRYTQREREVL